MAENSSPLLAEVHENESLVGSRTGVVGGKKG